MDDPLKNHRVSLKEYLEKLYDAKMNDLKEYFESRFKAMETALALAERILNARLEHMNDVKGQLKDQANSFLTRQEYILMHDRLVSDVQQLREFKSTLEGKASQKSVATAYLIAGFGLILSVVSLIKEFVK